MHGVRWSDGTASLAPPGPDAASGTHTYVAFQTDMVEGQLRLFWDRRDTTPQRLETSNCFLTRVVVAGGNQIEGVQALPIATARQLRRSADGTSLLGSAVQTRASSQEFAATVHVYCMADNGEATTQCFTIRRSVFKRDLPRIPVSPLEIFASDFASVDTGRTGSVPRSALPVLLAVHLQREPTELEAGAVGRLQLADPITFAAWVQWTTGERVPADAYSFNIVELQGIAAVPEGNVETSKRWFQSVSNFNITHIAAALHAKWAEGRRQADGTLEPRIKVVEGIEYDIANLAYDGLPLLFQTANLQAAQFALRHIEMAHVRGDDITSDEWLELASAKQHIDWMAQNSWCTDPLLMRPYDQLAETQKEKDRDVVKIARQAYIENYDQVAKAVG